MSEAIYDRQDKTGNIKVTVAMPVYNGGKHLRLAVLSIVRQTEQNWEMFIIDDGSTDNALATISDIKDTRIRILRDGSNKGLAQRLNEAMDLARGKYFARMDHDDISFPERFSRQLAALEQDPELDLLSCGTLLIDECNRPQGMFPAARTHHEICHQPWRGFYLPHPGWMGRTAWFRQYRYAIPGPYCSEDQELLLRSHAGSKFAALDECLLAYRILRSIRLQKLFATRLAMLRFQARYFLRQGKRYFLLLAIAAFCYKVVSDIGKWACRKPLYQVGATGIEGICMKWDRLLQELTQDCGPS